MEWSILDLGTRWMKPGPIYPRGRCHRYPLNRRLDRSHSQPGRCGGKVLSPVGNRNAYVQGRTVSSEDKPSTHERVQWWVLSRSGSLKYVFSSRATENQFARCPAVYRSLFCKSANAFKSLNSVVLYDKLPQPTNGFQERFFHILFKIIFRTNNTPPRKYTRTPPPHGCAPHFWTSPLNYIV
jgi:hypothetical protein